VLVLIAAAFFVSYANNFKVLKFSITIPVWYLTAFFCDFTQYYYSHRNLSDFFKLTKEGDGQVLFVTIFGGASEVYDGTWKRKPTSRDYIFSAIVTIIPLFSFYLIAIAK
jgi:hypothetical protein